MKQRNSNPALRIRKVFIEGNKRTNAQVFDNELQDAYEAQDIVTVREELIRAAGNMSRLGIFDSVDVRMEKVEGDAEQTDVMIKVKEKNWWKVSIGATTTDGYEATGETKVSLINPLGSADSLHASLCQGHVGSSTKLLHYARPRALGLPLNFNAYASDEMFVYQRFSSYNERYRGGVASLMDESGTHELAVNIAWRDIIPRRHRMIPSAFAASKSIISEATPSTKTSVKYVYTADERDDPITPTAGTYFSGSTEVAGGMGDVEFVKAEANAQKHFPIGPEIFGAPLLTLSLAGRVGGIKTYGKDQDRCARITDRFFLGGPTSLRGFLFKGVGPRAAPEEGGNLTGDSLGGEVLYSASASLGFPVPIPILAMMGLRCHFFANAGNLTGWDRVLDKDNWLKNAVEDARAAAGVGLVLKTSLGRIEANYSWILQSQAHDHVKHSQVGISATFS